MSTSKFWYSDLIFLQPTRYRTSACGHKLQNGPVSEYLIYLLKDIIFRKGYETMECCSFKISSTVVVFVFGFEIFSFKIPLLDFGWSGDMGGFSFNLNSGLVLLVYQKFSHLSFCHLRLVDIVHLKVTQCILL